EREDDAVAFRDRPLVERVGLDQSKEGVSARSGFDEGSGKRCAWRHTEAPPWVREGSPRGPLPLNVDRATPGLGLVYLRLGKPLYSDEADAVVEGVGDVEVAGLVHGRAERVVQAARVGGSAVPGELVRPVAGDRGDDLRLRIPLADQVIVGIRDVERSVGGERDAGGPGEARRELVGHPLVTILRPVAGDRADGARGQVYLPDAPRESVRGVESA